MDLVMCQVEDLSPSLCHYMLGIMLTMRLLQGFTLRNDGIYVIASNAKQSHRSMELLRQVAFAPEFWATT